MALWATRLADQSVVDIWTISLDEPRAAILTEEERSRAARFHFERDRLRWTHARSALRAVLGQHLGTAPLDVRFAFGPHGKPAVEGVEFNISHSRGWAMIAVAGEAPVGVDIEAIRGDVDISKLLLRVGEIGLTGSPSELFHAWTRREAKTKALGIPLMEIPRGDVRAIDVEAPPGFAASVALVGCDPVVRHRRDITI
jgi:4'-phosphopantetheinyl transferase